MKYACAKTRGKITQQIVNSSERNFMKMKNGNAGAVCFLIRTERFNERLIDKY